MRKLLLLINPLFRKHCRCDLPRILAVFRQAGIEVEVQETEAGRTAGGKVQRAIGKGFDAVIVCGGDGTVFDVLQGVAGSDLPLGIIPFGTGNVLAQNLKIPKNAVAAAGWILSSKPKAVPLGKITCCSEQGEQSWFFAMSAGMGVHAAMMEAARRSGKERAGRAAYFAAGLGLLLRQPGRPFEIEITSPEGRVAERQVSEVIALRVGELNFWRPGGGIEKPFLRLATVDGGSRTRLAGAVAGAVIDSLFFDACARDRRQAPDSPTHYSARYEDVVRVVCRPIPGAEPATPIPVQADGELLGDSYAEIEMAGVSLRLLAGGND